AGLDAISRGAVDEARAIAAGLPAAALDRHIIQWAMAVSGNPAVASGEIEQAMASLEGWPGLGALRRNLERALHRERPAPERVVAVLAGSAPLTYAGTIALARAHVALGDSAAALAVLTPFWRTERLDAREELTILKEFGGLIGNGDHRYRLERMMHLD